jgi:hypothetical protein
MVGWYKITLKVFNVYFKCMLLIGILWPKLIPLRSARMESLKKNISVTYQHQVNIHGGHVKKAIIKPNFL